MGPNRSVAALVRQSSELVRESAELKLRARETMLRSAIFMDRAMHLLSSPPFSGTPSVPAPLRAGTEPEPASTGGPVMEAATPAREDGAGMERVVEQNFADGTVRLDGRHFIDCLLENCTLEYSGGPMIVEGTNFKGCRFRFGGEAAMTVSVLECFGLIGEQQAEGALWPSRPTAPGRVN